MKRLKQLLPILCILIIIHHKTTNAQRLVDLEIFANLPNGSEVTVNVPFSVILSAKNNGEHDLMGGDTLYIFPGDSAALTSGNAEVFPFILPGGGLLAGQTMPIFEGPTTLRGDTGLIDLCYIIIDPNVSNLGTPGNPGKYIKVSYDDPNRFNNMYCMQVRVNAANSSIVGRGDIILPSRLQIYPNPASSEVSIEVKSDQGKISGISVADFSGRSILIPDYQIERIGGREYARFNISTLSNGLYFIKVEDHGRSMIGKMIVKRQ